MWVDVLIYRQGERPYVIGPFVDRETAAAEIDRRASAHVYAAWTVPLDEPTGESAETVAGREQAGESRLRAVSTDTLVTSIRERANDADQAARESNPVDADATLPVVLALSAARLEARAAAFHIVDAIDDLSGAVVEASQRLDENRDPR